MHTPPLILLIDDDPQIQDLFGTKLKASGFGVTSASSGAEGLKTAEQEKPDLILLDILMPGMDGGKTLLELKAHPGLKSIPVYILTSLEDKPEDIHYAQEAGAVDFLNKDIDFEELIRKIKEALGI